MRSTAICLSAVLWASSLAHAASLPEGFTESTVASNLVSPVVMEVAPDGRIFICEQDGKLRVVKNGQLLATPFVTVATEFHLDRGLLSVAFDPNFTTNNYVYLLYTSPGAPAHNIISRFTANGDVAVPGSEVQLFHLSTMPNTHHCDATIKFGPDGKLYVSVADNGNGNNAQSLNNMFGKMLRINSNGTIPTDNPFYNQASGDNRAIWALGLRNPFTFTFQPGTGRMLINDVGWEWYDEINEGVAGSNYGWPVVEGMGGNPSYRDPIFIIHQFDQPIVGSAITGGVFYNPPANQFPASYTGKYFFMDYTKGWIRLLDTQSLQATMFATNLPVNNVNLRIGNDGSLYYMRRGSGTNTGALMRIQYALSSPPTITQHPQSQSSYPGGQVTFNVSASGSSPFTYQWQRNGGDINGATQPSYTLNPVQLADNGAQFRCVVTNDFGTATSNAAVLTVQQNNPPVATILTPAAGFLYTAGTQVQFSGSGTDPQDGQLPASAFTWWIDQIRPSNERPFIPPFGGVTSGQFLAPDEGQPDADVGYRIYLQVQDSLGATHTVSREIWGRVVNVTLASDPAGLTLNLGGVPYVAPHTFQGVVGFRRILNAPLVQSLNGVTYDFAGWSDGGAAEHEIVTPEQDTTFTALYLPRTGPLLSSFLAFPGDTVHAGTEVTFIANAAGNGPFTWEWDFGDGATGTTVESAKHVYPAEGQYLVGLTVIDSHGLIATDALLLTVIPPGDPLPGPGPDPGPIPDPNPTPFALPLTVAKLQAKMDFAQAGKDSVTLKCTIAPDIAPDPVGDAVLLDVNGATLAFTLKKGRSRSTSGNITVTSKASKASPGRTVTVNARLNKGAWANLWVTNADKAALPHPMQLRVTVGLGGKVYEAFVEGLFKPLPKQRGKFQKP